MFQLTVSAKTPEELLANLLSAAAAMQSGSYNITGDEVNKGVKARNSDADNEEKTEPTGRRSSRRGVENKSGEDAADEPTSRRSLGACKEKLVDDDEEQAALRAQLITDLQVLADDENAHKAVADALDRVGAKNVHEIASTLLGDFNEDIQPLLAETEEPAGDDAELRAKVITDLADLQDVIDNPEKEGEDIDVTETLKKAYTAASAKPRGMDKDDAPEKGVLTNAKNLDKIAAKDMPHFAAQVSGLIAKYFG